MESAAAAAAASEFASLISAVKQYINIEKERKLYARARIAYLVDVVYCAAACSTLACHLQRRLVAAIKIN